MLPSQALRSQHARHKVFLSYYHHDDQAYRNAFERAFGRLYITKSVQPGEIASENSAEYIKRLILGRYIEDASVVVVLVGAKTRCRKHVDWETSAGLNKKVGGYSGLMGILLPSFPMSAGRYQRADLPARLALNVKSGYATVYSWQWITASSFRLTSKVDEAFDRREIAKHRIRNLRLPQMQRNTCD